MMDEDLRVIEVSAKTYAELFKLVGDDRELIAGLTDGRTVVMMPLDGIAITQKR